MHFVVKAPNLAHMYMTPKKVNLAIVPSQIFPVGAVAAIFKNGRHFIIFHSIYRFSGGYISEKVLPNTSCHCIRHFGGNLYKMATIYKVIRLSQKLRGAEPFVGRRFQKKYCQIYHTILSDIVKPILQNGGHFQSNTSSSEPKRRRASNVNSMYRNCGALIPEKYCHLHHANIYAILEAILNQKGGLFSKLYELSLKT